MIAGAVNFTPNWEDADYTRDSSTARVGIDFFLTPTNSLIVALSNRGKLRIMELSDHVSNTQVEILASWRWVYSLSTREAMHTTLWEALKLESVNKKFYDGIAQSFTDLIQHLEKSGRHHEESKLFASRLHGRLLFVWFLRKKKGIISERFDYFTTTDLSATEYYTKRLSPLFFECLNTPVAERHTLDRDTPYLNGWLFDPKTDGYDWAASTLTFPEGFFDRLYTHFDQFNFTTDESTPDYEQIAIDPEMLGRIFENLLATQVEATGEQARKAKGAFYTPREIVSYMCRESLRQYLYTRCSKHESIDRLLDTSVSDWAKAGTNSRRDNYTPEEQRSIIGALDDITILDPACGSGAYPMGMLQMMLQCYERLDTRYDPYQVKLQIIKNNLYGVDIEPMAVEIARLRAWLSLIVDEPSDSKHVKPLPNLDFKFVCANTLIPLASESGIFDKPWLKDEMKTLRDDYYSTTSRSKKESLKAKFEKLLDLGKGEGLFGSKQEQQLKSYHPFNVVSSCWFFDPEFMFGIEDGFDMVIGNPPYVQLQKFARTQIQKDLQDVGYYTFQKTGDLYALFYERGLELTKKHTGVLSYITSNKWMRAGYGDKLRAYFSDKNPLVLIDCGPGIFESATVDTNIIMVQNAPNTDALHALTLAKDDRWDIASALRARWSHLPSPGSWPWFIGSPAEIALKTKIESIGKPLKEWDVKIYRWVLTGLNEAFIIDRVTRDRWSQKIQRASKSSSRSSEGEISSGMDMSLQSCMWLLWNTISHMSSRNIQLFSSILKDLNKNSEKEDSAILLEVVSELHEKSEKLGNITI
jgi:type I restriction-modification system DNA methylase subunit